MRVLRARRTPGCPLFPSFRVYFSPPQGGLDWFLTARLKGPLSEMGPLRANGTVHAALPLPFSGFRACLYYSPEGGLFGLPLRATFSPAHPLARRDVPLARARAFRFSIPLCKGVAKAALYCAHRATTVSSWGLCEQEGHLAAPFPSLDCPFHRLL